MITDFLRAMTGKIKKNFSWFLSFAIIIFLLILFGTPYFIKSELKYLNYWIASAFLMFILPIIKYYYSRKKEVKILSDYYEILITLSATFLGAILAIFLTIGQNDEEEKNNYKTFLKTSIKTDEYYIEEANKILKQIDSVKSNNIKIYSSIEDVKSQFILEEIIKKGFLYKYSSEYFKNWITKIIAEIRKVDLTVSKQNRSSYKFLKDYLIYKKNILEIEINFIDSSYNCKKIKNLYAEALVNFVTSLLAENGSSLTDAQLSNNLSKNKLDILSKVNIDSAIYHLSEVKGIRYCVDSILSYKDIESLQNIFLPK